MRGLGLEFVDDDLCKARDHIIVFTQRLRCRKWPLVGLLEVCECGACCRR